MEPSDDDRWEAAQEGAELLLEGSVDRAVDELERVLRADPKNEHAYYYLGNAHYEGERYDKALKAYLEALALRALHPGAMVGAGHALRMLGRLDEALKVARHGVAARKDDPDLQYLLGVLLFQRGDRAEAKRVLEKFLEMRPEVELVIEVQGMLQVLEGEVLPFPGSEDN